VRITKEDIMRFLEECGWKHGPRDLWVDPTHKWRDPVEWPIALQLQMERDRRQAGGCPI